MTPSLVAPLALEYEGGHKKVIPVEVLRGGHDQLIAWGKDYKR